MKFDDEYRPASAVTGAKRARIAADMDGFLVKYDGLVYRDARNTAAVANLQKQIKELQRQLLQVKTEQTRRSAELRHSKAENEKLKDALAALRNSWRLRVGVAATSPFRWVGSAARKMNTVRASVLVSQTGNGHSGDSESGELDSVLLANGQRITGRPMAAVTGEPKNPTVTKVEKWMVLTDSVKTNPTKDNVFAAAAFGYYTMGEISRPLQLLLEHKEHLADLTPKEGQLVRTLEGLRAVMNRDFALAQRQRNPVYQAERGRLLYCAHSVAPYNSNGYSTRTGGLVEGMSASGLDVVVAARPGYPWDVKTDVKPQSSASFEKTINGTSHFFSSGPSWAEDRLDFYFEKSVDSYVQVAMRSRAEMVQAASNHVTALPALIAARRLGLPFIYEVRGLWEITKASTSPQWAGSEAFELAERLETFVACAADLVFAITEQVRDELIARGVSAKRIKVLSNAVNTSSFSPMPPHESTRQKLGLTKETAVIGYAGSLVEYEGLETLLEASKLLEAQGLDFRTVIVGDGSALPRLIEKTKQLDIGDKVIFTGRVSPEEISDYISVFDVLPCPRLPMPVTEMVSPLKPLEAMAAGKAVVLSDLPPLRDIAGADGVRARLFRAGDAVNLAEVLTDLIRDEDQRRTMGRRARLWTVKERDWKQIGAIARTTLTASSFWHGQGSLPDSRRLSDITVGIIADPFTTAGLEPEVSLVKLRPDMWAQQIAASPIDILFVESAWEGNDGIWRGKVGFYDDDSFGDLRELIAYCRKQSIPTVFWNKEDPVHFNRFKGTAEHFDHVFTSDDGSIEAYLQNAGSHVKSVSSLPFYAQPMLHNPLPGRRDYSHTVAYAGSYYGDRYKKRSAQLQRLLAAAIPVGLSIYDRQHLNPESPYKFPDALAPFVRGALSYEETVDAYKSHPVHINVNSVEASGTMFSRRVYEIAACGGAVLSGPGLGIQRMFGGIIPIADDKATASLLIDYWMANEDARKADAWLGMRAVYRSHTAGHRLAYVLRTAGLRVTAPQLEAYAVVANRLTEASIAELETQSVPPAVVFVSEPLDSNFKTGLDIQVTHAPQKAVLASGVTLVATLPDTGLDRTYFEDLLTSRKYCQWKDAAYISDRPAGARGSLARLEPTDPEANFNQPGLHSVDRHVDGPAISLIRTTGRSTLSVEAKVRRANNAKSKTVLVAGHDLKFAQGIIIEMESQGHTVLIDQWLGHSEHDESLSRTLLAQADVIFCEWTLGNAAWYSKNKLSGQRLVTRLHLQEITTKYLAEVEKAAVDQFIFVGQHIANIAERDFGVPAEKSTVVPNYVPISNLQKPKDRHAQWNLGIVGTVPRRKRLDLALDALKTLRQRDDRYKLYVKGKSAHDYPWMKDRPEEFAFYEEQDRRIASDPLLVGAVFFDGHGDDMSEWYRKIGTVLSVSDFESFHLTLADGAASGAVPVTLAWEGADQIYPVEWIHASVAELAHAILETTGDATQWREAGAAAARYAEETFDQRYVLPQLVALITESGTESGAGQ
ncbi:glycosyltransferase involved in cell wall biosynthesis/spore maturation protein CgeB [Arthrobacter sp. UYP6]|uniref:glycosyltransferase n=1 Tax=Arthrobacter sp. UYP6 TaxID=1756378 RepID=UPI003395ED39